MQTPQPLTYIQLRSKSALIYTRFSEYRKNQINPSLRNFIERKKDTYSGEVTEHARKRLTRSVSLLNQCSPWQKVLTNNVSRPIDFKLSFITLTIPQEEPISGKEAYKQALYPFLRIMKARYSKFLYVYKAELQERGQVHYHITSNTYIPHTVVREVWNKILSKCNYMDEFIAEHGHNNAPSTEIRSVRNVADIEAYLVKYISKKDGLGRKIEGKVWGCSSELQGKKYYTELLSNVNITAIEALQDAGKVIVKVLDRFSIIKFINASPLAILSKNQYSDYKKYLNDIVLGVRDSPPCIKESLILPDISSVISDKLDIIKAQLTLNFN